MKKRYLLYLILFMITFSSCSKYGFVHLNYPQAPEAYLPEGVNDIVVVNRSLTKEEDKQKKTIESIATGEIAGSDKMASDEAIKGVYDGIHGKSGTKIIIPKELRIYGTGTRETPKVLDWERVSDICESNRADALLVLETFDSNSDFLISAAADQLSSVLTTGKPSPRVPGQARIDIKCYWRLYDPNTKSIADQFQQTHYMTFDLVNGVPPLNALPETAYNAGQDYTRRFLPSYYRVKRDMYKKGKGSDKNKFKTGWRRAEVANWKGAIELWSGIAENANSKSAGRAALNIAVAHEVLGNTELALKWAQKAYEDYGDKLGRDYAKILLRRKNIER
jgi:hypothetical protein